MIIPKYTSFLYKNHEILVQPEVFLFFSAIEAEVVLILFLFFGKNQLHCSYKIIVLTNIVQ